MESRKCAYCGNSKCLAIAEYEAWISDEIKANRSPSLKIRKHTHHAILSLLRFDFSEYYKALASRM